MNFSKLFFVFILTISLGLTSFNLPKNIKKKVAKEIKLAFDVEAYDLNEVTVSTDINAELKTKISKGKLFKIVSNNELLGYAYIDKAPSKTDEFDYLVLFDSDLIVKKAKILVYREDYGGEIGSKRWLKQFIGKETKDKLTYEKDIVAISGATISANSMTVAVNNLLQSIEKLHQHKVL